MQGRKSSCTKAVGVLTLVLALFAGCSTRKNTAGSRFYHALTTRYNVYFNGNEAYKAGLLAQQEGNQDNYLEMIPLYPVGNKATAALGTAEFDRAIEKAQKAIGRHSIKRRPVRTPGRAYTPEYRKWLARREFNPFLHNAWMLLGKAQFQKGAFEEAAVTFSYIARLYKGQPAVTGEALIRQAQCYAALGWNYDAEDALNRANNDSLPASLHTAYSSARADMLLRAGRLKEAVPYLRQAVEGERSRWQRARGYYLLGQVCQLTQQPAAAYQAYSKAIRLNPPYQLSLSARIAQSEVVPPKEADKAAQRLLKLARDGKNKDYQERIYYGLGNVYLARQDTAKAVKAYQTGVEKSTGGGVEKGVLQLSLGNIFWAQERYAEAARAYTDAIALLGQEHKAYKETVRRSEILDELVPHVSTIQLQDSLQYLASLSEEERMAVVERIIAEVKAREEAERQAAEDAELEEQKMQVAQLQGAIGRQPVVAMPEVSMGGTSSQEWYFYNQQAVERGRTEFLRTWGKRKLEDNWRRSNKTVVALDDFEEVDYSEPEDSTGLQADVAADGLSADSLQAPASGGQPTVADTTGNELHNPAYYLAQIPLTEEAMQASNQQLMEALFQAGVLFRERMHNLVQAERSLTRLVERFPEFERADEALYQLFLLEMERNYRGDGNGLALQRAEAFRDSLLARFPDSRFTRILADPDFVDNARYGRHREDSLYARAYADYEAGRYEAVAEAVRKSGELYPLGVHRPKFLFLEAASQLMAGKQKEFLEGLKQVVQNYPENEITDLAAHILRGVQEGRLLARESTGFGSIWKRRSAALTEAGNLMADSTRADVVLPDSAFSRRRDVPFLFMLAYEEGSLNENQLLYEVARYNFSTFLVKNFDLSFAHERGIGMLQVRPFANYDEAYRYFRRLYENPQLAERLSGIRAILISEDNYTLMLKDYSFDDYDGFFRRYFATIPELELKGYTLDEPLQNLPEEKPEEEEDENNQGEAGEDEEDLIIFEE